MSGTAKYPKIVEWSDEDQCYIGSCPGLIFGGCCHGDDEKKVFEELCEVVEWVIRTNRQDDRPDPPLPRSIELPAYAGPADLDQAAPAPISRSDRPSPGNELAAAAAVGEGDTGYRA